MIDAEVDDLLLRVADVPHDLPRSALEDPILQAAQLAAELTEHRKAGVHAAVQDLVEEPSRPTREELGPKLWLLLGTLPQRRQRHDVVLGHGDHIVGADEDVDLDRVQAPALLVEARELHDQEEVVIVDVELGALVDTGDILKVERVEAEVLGQPCVVGGARRLDVIPAQAARLDHLHPWLVDRGRSTIGRAASHPGSQQAGKLPHPPSVAPGRFSSMAIAKVSVPPSRLSMRTGMPGNSRANQKRSSASPSRTR